MLRVLLAIILSLIGMRVGAEDSIEHLYAHYTFPLSHAPDEPMCEGDTAFGADRDGGARLHAGCDLITAVGTPIYAVDDGIVLDYYYFYSGTYAIEVQHTDFIVRYGEVSMSTVPIGGEVRRGQLIGRVGRLDSGNSMLHFEMYRGDVEGNLTQNRPPFYRRSDLMNPTEFLKAWPYPFNGEPLQKANRAGEEND